MTLAFDADGSPLFDPNGLWIDEDCCDDCQGCSITADFSWVNTSGTSFSFTDTSTGDTADWWLWDFHDGTTSSAQNPSHTFDNTEVCNNWEVTLLASCDGGSTTSSITKWVSAAACVNPPVIHGISAIPIGNFLGFPGQCTIALEVFVELHGTRSIGCVEWWINGVAQLNSSGAPCHNATILETNVTDGQNATIRVRVTDTCNCQAEMTQVFFIDCAPKWCGSCVDGRPGSITVTLPDFLQPYVGGFQAINPCTEAERPESRAYVLTYSNYPPNTKRFLGSGFYVGLCNPPFPECCTYETFLELWTDHPCNNYDANDGHEWLFYVKAAINSGSIQDTTQRIRVEAWLLKWSFFPGGYVAEYFVVWETLHAAGTLFPPGPLPGEYLCTGTYNVPVLDAPTSPYVRPLNAIGPAIVTL